MANLLHTLSTNLNLNGEEGWNEEDEESFPASMTLEVNTAEQNVDDIEDAKEDEDELDDTVWSQKCHNTINTVSEDAPEGREDVS